MSFNALSSSILESPPRIQRTSATVTASYLLESPIQDSRSISTQSLINLPPKTNPPSLDLAVHGLSLMGPSTPSPPTAPLLSLSSRPVDYFGRAWEGSSYKLNDYTRKNTSNFAPRSKDLRSCSLIEHSENNLSPAHHEAKSKDLSRHQSSTNNNFSSYRNRHPKQPSQKVMLSKALQKANTAVLLDNAQNFEGAIQAYSEACSFLEKVMIRGSGDDDRRKLEAICNTYTSRINELRRIPNLLTDNGKALPIRPDGKLQKNHHHHHYEFVQPDNQEEDEDTEEEEEDDDNDDGEEDHYEHEKDHEDDLVEEIKSPSTSPSHDFNSGEEALNQSMFSPKLPPRRESLLQLGIDSSSIRPNSCTARLHEGISQDMISGFEIPLEDSKTSPMLSPQPSISSRTRGNSIRYEASKSPSEDLWYDNINLSNMNGHVRLLSNDSMSWVDKVNEFDHSIPPSIQREKSSLSAQRKMINVASIETEAEFDAALDAAVEAAYDDVFMPIVEYNKDFMVRNMKHKVELGEKELRQIKCQTIPAEDLGHKIERTQLEPLQMPLSETEDENDANKLEDEDPILEEMTRDYAMDEFEFGLNSNYTIPRESDSSGFSGRTWNSSIGSNPTTAATILSTVSEMFPANEISSPSPNNLIEIPSPPLPPSQPPPPTPQQVPALSRSFSEYSSTLKTHRLSGHSFNIQLAPESNPSITTELTQSPITEGQPRSRKNATKFQHIATETNNAQQSTNNTASTSPKSRPPVQSQSSLLEINTSDYLTCLSPALTPNSLNNAEILFSRPISPNLPQPRGSLRKKFSSSSLRNAKIRNNTTSIVEDGTDNMPGTPNSSRLNSRSESIHTNHLLPGLPHLNNLSYREKQNGNQAGNTVMHNHDTTGNKRSRSSSLLDSSISMSLEPCPTEYLLRPFWLMRAFYQTLTHPKGGYISTKLFVPSDVWRVKGVKIKNVEEKIVNCELITAALSKVARVDTYDADAILDEMQALEIVIEQSQTALAKKLGNEVGVQHFSIHGGPKDCPVDCESESTGGTSKLGNSSSKSPFSWRRLRPKNPGAGFSHTYSTKSNPEVARESFNIASLPMTSSYISRSRYTRKELSQVQFTGPNSNYMSALARLFDAAQIVDQIARQVLDPGLRHADKTQVGLDLCTRHIAEFFGFYICRFVLSDIAMLSDKFIKKGGEWVLI